MIKKQKIWSFILSAMLVLSLTTTFSFIGCKKEAAPAEEEVAEEEVAEEVEEEVTEEGKVKVGFSAMNAGWPWFASFIDQFDKRCAEKGWEGITLSAKADVSTQLAQIQDFITMGVDYLLVSPLDPKAATPVLKKAYEAGVKVINVTNLIDEEAYPYVVAIRLPNDVDIARGSMELMIEALDGKGEIVVVDGVPGQTGNIHLWDGINEALNSPEGKGVKILASEPAYFDSAKAIPVTEDLLTRFPDADGVLSIDGAMTSGVIQVVREVGYTGVVVGCAGTIAEKEGVLSGELYGTTCKSPKQNCDAAIDVIEQLIEGKDVEKLQYLPVVKVTKENIDECWGDW